jgi:hypothetical protein
MPPRSLPLSSVPWVPEALAQGCHRKSYDPANEPWAVFHGRELLSIKADPGPEPERIAGRLAFLESCLRNDSLATAEQIEAWEQYVEAWRL